MSEGWINLQRNGLDNHLFRFEIESAWKRLTDFAVLQALTTELPGRAIRNLVAEYETLLARMPDGPERQQFCLWESFFREREHILRRGDERWPTNRILLQLAIEHADDSPVTLAAEAWLAEGNCDWVWLRNPQRAKHVIADSCLQVLEGRNDSVLGANLLSGDNTLQIWQAHNFVPFTSTTDGHSSYINGILSLSNSTILSWSYDHTLRLWEQHNGAQLAILAGHTDQVWGAIELLDGRILSWSKDKTLRLWDGQTGQILATYAGHTDWVWGAKELTGERILSWSLDGCMHLWNSQTGELLAESRACPSAGIWNASELSDGSILFLAVDHTLRLWDMEGQLLLATFFGHSDLVGGFEELTDGNILSWSGDGTLRLWDRQSGQMMATLAGHTGWIWDAKELPDGRILSWSRDKTLRLWNRHSGQLMASIAAHTDWDRGFYVLADGKILCQSKDGNLRLRDDHTGELIGEPISEKELPWNNPQLLYRRAQAHSAKWTSGQTAAWFFGSTLGVAACTDQSYPACWQDDSPAQIHALLAAGVLILTLENNKLLCLQLYRGSERITVKEYERDFRDKHEEAEVPQNIDCLSIPLTQGSDAAVARTFGG